MIFLFENLGLGYKTFIVLFQGQRRLKEGEMDWRGLPGWGAS